MASRSAATCSSALESLASTSATFWLLSSVTLSAAGEFALLHVATGSCLALQGGGSANLEVAPCEAGSAAQTFAYNPDDGTLRLSRAPNAGLLVNTC